MAASKKDNVNAGRVEYLGDDREGKLAALNNAVAAIEKTALPDLRWNRFYQP